MSEVRFLDRQAQLKRRRIKRIVGAIVAVVVAGALVWVVAFSEVLAVRTVEVGGETTLTEDQVRAAAEVPIGRPLARLDTVAIESRVASMERVESVEVSRSWPRTVEIALVERRAVAWLEDGGRIRGLDRFGVDFRTFDEAPDGLLEVEVAETEPRARQQTLEAVAGLVDFLESNDPELREQIQSISADTKDSIVLDLTEGRTVTWGSGADEERKLIVLEPLLRIDAEQYDVSAPDQPTTRE